MYCKKCGNQMEDNAKFCGKCGTTVENSNNAVDNGTKNGSDNDKNTTILTVITAVVSLISPFLPLFSLKIFGEYSFSPVKLLSLMKDSTSSKYSNDTDVILSYGILIVYLTLFVITIITLIKALQNISNEELNGKIKFFKNITNANSGMFMANLIAFIILFLVNISTSSELHSDTIVWVYNATPWFYIMIIVGLVGYVISRSKYKAYKKILKKQSVNN